MYSLGISFFEMCFRPLSTGMERITIISNLRLPTVQFPDSSDSFDMIKHKSQIRVVRWLLHHDASQRPTAADLLSDDLLPRPPLEEAQFVDSLRRALNQTGSTNYYRLMSTMFDRNLSLAQDHIWDLDFHQQSKEHSQDRLSVSLPAREEALVVSRLESIFSKHGAVRLKTPLLLPKSMALVDARAVAWDQAAQVLDSNGAISFLPVNLRLPFSRYVARHNVTDLKRYVIDRVYHARRIPHVHPRELVECAFDIVTSSPGNLIPDAEIIYVVQDVINAFPVLGAKNYVVKLNHPQLVKAVLLHHGVPEEKFPPLFQLLTDSRNSPSSKFKVQLELEKLSLSDATIQALYALLFETEGPLKRINAILRPVTKSKGGCYD
jgi:translation initiation factor 2-alpha kinase 4